MTKQEKGDIALVVSCVALILAVLLWAAFTRAQESNPKLSEAEKLEIRDAQVDLLNAQQAVQQSQPYQAMMTAQTTLNDALAKIMKAKNLDPAKYTLDGKLNLVPRFQQPPTPPAPAATAPVPVPSAPPAAKAPEKKP